MADTVRYLMEEMLPELEDFEKKGYFSREEIKQIVKQRENFEYLLKRKSPLRRDFLRYAPPAVRRSGQAACASPAAFCVYRRQGGCHHVCETREP